MFSAPTVTRRIETVPASYHTGSASRIRADTYGTPLICTRISSSPGSILEGEEQLYRWSYRGVKQHIVIEGDRCEGFGVLDDKEYNRKQRGKQEKQEEEFRNRAIEVYADLKTSMSPEEFMTSLRHRLGWSEEKVEAHERMYQERLGKIEGEKGVNGGDAERESEPFDEMEESSTQYRNETESDNLKASSTQSAPPVWDTRHKSSVLLEKPTHTPQAEVGGCPLQLCNTAPDGTLKETVPDKETTVTSHPQTLQSHIHQSSIALVNRIKEIMDSVQHSIRDHNAAFGPTSTTIEPTSQATATAIFEMAHLEKCIIAAKEPASHLVEEGTGGEGLKESIWGRWLQVDFKSLNSILANLTKYFSTAATISSVPTPTPDRTTEQESQSVDWELDDSKVIRVPSTESLMITSAYPELSVSSTETAAIDLDEDANLKSELRKRSSLDRINDIDANSFEASKITSADQGTATPSSLTNIQQEKKVESKTGLRDRGLEGAEFYADDALYGGMDDSDDWLPAPGWWLLFKIKRFWKDLYQFQHTRLPTLQHSRLQTEYLSRKTNELKVRRTHRIKATRPKPKPKPARPMPDYSRCRLDDMIERPGPDNPICDPHYFPQYPSVSDIGTPTGPQIQLQTSSASNSLLPFNSPFAVLILFLFVFILLFWNNDSVRAVRAEGAERAGMRVANSPTVVRLDLNRDLDDDDEYRYSSDSVSEYGSDGALESHRIKSAALKPKYTWCGIEEHLRRTGMLAPDYENGGGGDGEYWQ